MKKNVFVLFLSLVPLNVYASHQRDINADNISRGTLAEERLFSGDMNRSSFTLSGTTQIAPVRFSYRDIRLNITPRTLGALIVSQAGDIFISTGTTKGAWNILSQPFENDAATDTRLRFEFNPSPKGGITSNATYENKASSISGSLNGISEAVFTSSGLNNTSALKFGNTTGQLVIEDSSLFSSHAGGATIGTMSVSFWVYFDSASGSIRDFVAKQSDANNNEFIIQYQADQTLKSSLLESDGTDFSTFTSSPAVLNFGEWNHIVVVWDKVRATGDKTRMYVNNNLMSGTSSDPGTTTSDTNSPVLVGFRASGTACDCVIDKLKFFPYRLGTVGVRNLFSEKVR